MAARHRPLIDLAEEPRLILGWRLGRRLEAGRISLHQDTFDDLRAIAGGALAQLAASSARPYEPNAALEIREEHFAVPLDIIPAPPAPGGGAGGGDVDVLQGLPQVADLVRLVRDADTLDPIDAAGLSDGGFLFYGIVFSDDGGNTAFIKKIDPTAVAHRGRAFLRFAGALRRVARPELVLFSDVDLVLTPTHVLAFNKNAFETLLTDVRLVVQDVPVFVDRVERALAAAVPLTPAARDALRAVCGSRPTFAARLRALPGRLQRARLTPARVREAVVRHGEDATQLIDGSDKFAFSEENVRSFLDVVEGRWFEDDFTGEPRRADRMSTRRRPT